MGYADPAYNSDAEPWWTMADGVEAARAAIRSITSLSSWRNRELLQYTALVDAYERERWRYISTEARKAIPEERRDDVGVDVSNNIIGPAVDTMTARLFSELPNVSVKVSAGCYDDHMAGRRMQMALDSVMFRPSNQRELMEVLRDGTKTGIGVCRWILHKSEPICERLSLTDLWWNPEDARYTRSPGTPPRYLGWRQRIARDALIEAIESWEYGGDEISKRRKNAIITRIRQLPAYCDRSNEIDSSYARTYYDQAMIGSGVTSGTDQVELFHHCHLGPDGDDGRYLVHVYDAQPGQPETIVVYDGEWDCNRHEIVWWTPYPTHQGLVGRGIGHVGQPYQAQVDAANNRLQELIDVYGKATILFPAGTPQGFKQNLLSPGLNAATLPTNTPLPNGHILVTHNPQPEQLLNWTDIVEAKFNARIGLNSGVMQGGTQLGANASGVALRVEDTRSDIRFGDMLKNADTFLCDCAEIILAKLDMSSDTENSYAMRWQDEWGDAHETAWNDLRLEPGTYSLEIVGASIRSKAQRVRMLEEAAVKGQVPQEMVAQQVAHAADEPYVMARMTAAEDLVEWQLFWLTQDSDDFAAYWPDEHTPLALARDRVKREIQIAKRQRASDSVLARLIEYHAKAMALEDEIAAKATPPPMPGIGGSAAMAEAPMMPMAPGIPGEVING